ncbi:MAG: excinuclease ABC subunit UvrC [Candidatus Marinimicrobia bacterium]|nr:excinuclease ABC subunit UvrC [Candidatus Neomarinimicrobiota bacterium]
MIAALKETLASVPTKPGVYQFKNKDDEIIYIGKAKNLRSRVRSYFQKNKYQTPKNQSMIKRIENVEWIVVRSNVEALLTEANMIKEVQPKYNIDLKDDKSFPFIRISDEPYPQVLLTRKIEKDGSKYFGPYTDVKNLRYSLKALHKIFPVRSCSYYMDDDSVAAKKVKVCLDYHIKKCEGPCEGFVNRDHYNAMIERVIKFLQGRTKETEEYVRRQMEIAAADLRYEDAAMYRDQLNAVRRFKERQRKVTADFDDRDIFALARQDDIGVMTILRVRNGRIFGREKVSLQNLDENEAPVFASVISRFYMDTDFLPKEITVSVLPEGQDELEEWLSDKKGSKVIIRQPQRGEKAKEVRMSYQNAKLLLGEWLINRKKRRELVPKMVNQLQEDLQLKAPPRRIEAFDISHLGGTNTVASMVCFVDGKARKSEYRKFKVKTVEGIDDFAAMREVVHRRYLRVKKEQGSLPDLILIDGGKGQLSMAVSALRELGLDYVPIVGLAKRLEEVFVPGQSEAQSIHKQSPGLILLRRIRDEAHRFAITFQRSKRKDSLTSLFNDIDGMGPKRVQKLLQSFDSTETIAKSTQKDISTKTGIPEKLAEEIIKIAISTLK